jgi:Uma2 family endonuclease
MYMTIPSLREYFVVDQYRPDVFVFYRTDSGLWDIRKVSGLDGHVILQSIQVTVAMEEIYRGVVFE